jgi:hypothetical protein
MVQTEKVAGGAERAEVEDVVRSPLAALDVVDVSLFERDLAPAHGG